MTFSDVNAVSVFISAAIAALIAETCSSPSRSWIDVCVSPMRQKMDPNTRALFMDVESRILFVAPSRRTCRHERLRSMKNCAAKPARRSALAAGTDPPLGPSTSFSASAPSWSTRLSHAAANASTRASLSFCFASELVSTDTRSTKNSAGLALEGMGCPSRSNHSPASVHAPWYTHLPFAIRHRSSNIATMLPLGWWIEHTTARRASTASFLRDSTTRCAWNASRPDVGSSQHTT
mmetsp:Transcript_6267/g.25959  ORF Transcript_6267/g.25959 Transcript_6267/m.25959 type:complete len:235 (+) Transcript_6267:1949-2653(+)